MTPEQIKQEREIVEDALYAVSMIWHHLEQEGVQLTVAEKTLWEKITDFLVP